MPPICPQQKKPVLSLARCCGFCFAEKQLTAPRWRDKIKTQQGNNLKNG